MNVARTQKERLGFLIRPCPEDVSSDFRREAAMAKAARGGTQHSYLRGMLDLVTELREIARTDEGVAEILERHGLGSV